MELFKSEEERTKAAKKQKNQQHITDMLEQMREKGRPFAKTGVAIIKY